ncbi:MAG: DUF1365 domain-containing protein [Steroidobacteraceae bacterium]|jgi:DUF1365 family protein
MELSSCLYQCEVWHQRLAPRRYALRHALFMSYIDLDEIDDLARTSRLFSRNRWNLYSFRDADHMPGSGPAGHSLRHRVDAYLSAQGIALGPHGRIRLLTLPRILGYVFNPISIYFCFEHPTGAPVCALAEVGNTFGEQKLYLLRTPSARDGGRFSLRIPKHFYVSPFSSLSLQFEFNLRTPAQTLSIRIDDYDGERRVLRSGLSGLRQPWGDARLLWFLLKYPLLTLQVIGLIHWHALQLWLKGLPWHRKAENPHLQRQVLRSRVRN